MKLTIIIILLACYGTGHWMCARSLGSMVYTMFYINSVQCQEEFKEYCRGQDILELKWLASEATPPEYKAELEAKIRILERKE